MRTRQIGPALLTVFASIFLGACAHTGSGTFLAGIDGTAAPEGLAAGKKSVVTVEIKLKPGGHFSDGSPMSASLQPANLRIERAELSRTDAVVGTDAARFDIPVIPVTSGPASLDADLTYYVCTATSCIRENRHLTIPLLVQ